MAQWRTWIGAGALALGLGMAGAGGAQEPGEARPAASHSGGHSDQGEKQKPPPVWAFSAPTSCTPGNYPHTCRELMSQCFGLLGWEDEHANAEARRDAEAGRAPEDAGFGERQCFDSFKSCQVERNGAC